MKLGLRFGVLALLISAFFATTWGQVPDGSECVCAGGTWIYEKTEYDQMGWYGICDITTYRCSNAVSCAYRRHEYHNCRFGSDTPPDVCERCPQ